MGTNLTEEELPCDFIFSFHCVSLGQNFTAMIKCFETVSCKGNMYMKCVYTLVYLPPTRQWERWALEEQLEQSMIACVLGQDLCLKENPGMSLGTSEKLQNNDFTLAAFEWSTVQLLAFQLFVVKAK